MAVPLAPIEGLIELKDDFSSQLGLAEAALGQFSKTNQESLKSIATAGGLVAAAYGAILVATVKLGERGSEVADLDNSLAHFAGSAASADLVVRSMSDGLLGTLSRFELTSEAVKILSAGVRLTAEEFNLLGKASSVLADQGLGTVKENLDLISDALVNGKTKALEKKLGVIDLNDAEDRYAKTLGTTADRLSETGKVEAHRIEVLRLLTERVKDAGAVERDFGDFIAAGRAKLSDWVDSVAKAVAISPVFTAGLNSISKAFDSALGDANQTAAKETVAVLEAVAISAADVAVVFIETARVINLAWNGIKTVVLFVETGVIDLAETLASVFVGLAEIAEKAGLVTSDFTEELRTSRTELQGMTEDLQRQTNEAAAAVTGQSEFDKTLDKLAQTVFGVKNAMVAAQKSTEEHTEVTEEATVAAGKFGEGIDIATDSLVDQGKAQEELKKNLKELDGLWNDYHSAVIRNSGTSRDVQIRDIETWKNKQLESLDELDPLFRAKYTTIEAIAKEKLRSISTDWDSVRDKSRESLEDTLEIARNTYDEMIHGSLTFSREALDEQRKKIDDARDALINFGQTGKKSVETVEDALTILDQAWVDNAKIAETTLNRTTVMVRTLSGELISLQEAQNRRTTGGQFDVTSANFDTALKSFLTHGGFTSGIGTQQYHDPYDLARKGYSFQEVLKYAFDKNQQGGPLPPPQGPKIPGFAEGGFVTVGERGPEVVRLPFGSAVYPSGSKPSGGTMINNFYVNGTAQDVARKISQEIMRNLKAGRQFPAA